MTHDEGGTAGYSIAAIRRAAQNMDAAARAGGVPSFVGSGQMLMDFLETERPRSNDDILRAALEAIVIQRSLRTSRELAAAAGKELRFPIRREPETVEYNFDGAGEPYRKAIQTAERYFRPGVTLLSQMKREAAAAAEKGKPYDPFKLIQKALGGITLAAFLLDSRGGVGSTGKEEVCGASMCGAMRRWLHGFGAGESCYAVTYVP